MKKFRTAIFAVLACVLMLSLVACGGPDPAKIKGEQVDAEQWVKAFDFSDVTNVTVRSYEYYENGDYLEKNNILTKYTADKTSTRRDAEGKTENGPAKGTFERYTALEDGDRYFYDYDEESKTWSRRKSEYDYSDRWTIDEEEMSILRETYMDGFEKYNYDAEAKGYVFTEIDNMGGTVTKLVKIVNGKVVYTEHSISNKAEGLEYLEYKFFYDFDKTSVTLPTVAENS